MHANFFRGRRLRRSPFLRDMARETRLAAADLIMPYFVVETDDKALRREIAAMPGQFQLAPDALKEQAAQAVDAGLRGVLLFGLPGGKDPQGSGAWNPGGAVQRAVRLLKAEWPELVVITDVCLCEYTSHGHCGLLSADGAVLNDPTLEVLARVAVSHAQAGADMVAPSDMMDGRVQAVRTALDREGFVHLPIMSYAVKYASAYYGPFREAADSAPQAGDRKSYQMDPGNAREGLREAAADLAEGADILMVKPAGSYGDMIRLLADTFDAPVAAYQVSGEYSMIKAAGQLGWIDEQAVILESLIGIKRAGADMILTYFAEELLKKGLVT
ncbi:MAG: porphobilinogen synthase [Deltaproteobacteria bacterium]|jgi:porphobilinogen synthase|nr:porphobilinogen synthase [Deltaproteobacteria bacterium]